MNDYPLVWIIIGVSGSGKTTIGRLLAERLDCDFLEGDRRHPPQNIKKMRSNEPLGDEDRRSWLLKIENDIRRAIEQNQETVITCSALKASYRKQLTSIGRVQLIWINVSKSELERRLSQRKDHYMTIDLLQSQLDTFQVPEETEKIIPVDGSLDKNEIIDQIINAAKQFSDLQKPWWQRISAKSNDSIML
jgi:gluconokinase